MAEVIIERLTEATPEAVTQLEDLLRQLTKNAQKLDLTRLKLILASPGALYVAKADGKIIGSVCRLELHHPVRTRCWIDDVVVDETYRGQGIASGLLKMAIAEAPEEAASISLTSKVSRLESHRIYPKFGFEIREDTRVWRLMLPTRKR